MVPTVTPMPKPSMRPHGNAGGRVSSAMAKLGSGLTSDYRIYNE